MPEYLPYPQPVWARPSIDAVLDPGEEVVTSCDFFCVMNRQISRTLVLTNRNLRFVAFKVPAFGGRKPRPLIFNFAIPLHTVTAVGVSRVPGGLLRQAVVSIQVHWAGTPERWASHFAEADDLTADLEATFARRTAAADGLGIADEIARLGALTTEGVLTEQEFQRGKELFLGKPANKAAELVSLLRQLHCLYLGNVMSESEFNMKKWDLLSKT